ncbi:unnamed protein product, partial [marine sediment metagenome]
PETSIHCCAGSAGSAEAAVQAISSADAVVIDSTALATLFVLDELSLLQAMPMKCVVASGTLDELRGYLHSLEYGNREHKILAKEEGKYVWISVSAQDAARYRRRVSSLIETVEKICAVEPGTALADVTPEERSRLVELFGQSGAESVALARGQRRLLWADDLALGAIAEKECGVSRVWTQAVVTWLAGREHIGTGDADEVTVKLLVAGYFFTSLGPSAVLRAAQKASWDPSAAPLTAVAEHLVLPMIDGRKVWWVVGQSLALLWRQASV